MFSTGLNLQEFLFFDDDSANIKVCRDIGVTSCEVNKASGFNWESLVRGLEIIQDAPSIRKTESEDHEDHPA
eukprot:gene28917-35870_t